MNIALLPSAFYSDPTYHRVLSSLKREFARSGHRAIVISKEGLPSLARKTGESEKPALPLYDRRLPGKKRRALLIGALAERLSPGTVLNFHFSGWLRPWHAPVLLSERLAGARLVVTFQDYCHPDLPPLTSASRPAMRALLDRAHSVTAVSGFLSRMIARDFPSAAGKLRVIPNGADPCPAAGRRSCGNYILTVGRQAPYKGLDLLLFALADARGKGCDAGLVVCGAGENGPLRGLAEKLGIGDKVTFKGVVPPEEIGKLMKGCLFYATTPRWESFGMAALEAMAAGKAVLASRTGGLTEFARDGITALLTAPQDIGAISSAITRLCSDKGLRGSLGRNAAVTARAYSWKKIAAEYIRSAYGAPGL